MPNSQIRWLLHDSEILRRPKKRILALIPDAPAGKPLPVCYYLHGWGGTAEAYLNHKGIFETLASAQQISVFPESFRRWFINDHEGNRYEDYLIHEVIPVAEKQWLPEGGLQNRMIGGFSMGGLSALCMAWRYPELFTGVACFAGAFEAPQRVGDPYAHYRDRLDLLIPTERDMIRAWGEPGSAVRREYDPYIALDPHRLSGKRVYLSIGTSDFDRMIEMNRRIHAFLLTAQVRHKYEEYGHGHDMDLVASSLQSAVDYLSAREAA
jgi:putative tributyrin esterase